MTWKKRSHLDKALWRIDKRLKRVVVLAKLGDYERRDRQAFLEDMKRELVLAFNQGVQMRRKYEERQNGQMQR